MWGFGMVCGRVAAGLTIIAVLIGVAFSGTVAIAQTAEDATALNKRAIDLYHSGKVAEAIPVAQRALELREKSLPVDHPDIATSLNNLAVLYQDQGRLAEAEPLYLRALEMREKALPAGPCRHRD